MIFSKKFKFRQAKINNPRLIAFEQYLQLVSHLYYKASSSPIDFPVKENQETKNLEIPLKKEGNRPGRKAKNKNIKEESVIDCIYEDFSIDKKDQEKKSLFNIHFDVLDNLVSPIKKQEVFGKISKIN